MYSYFTGAGGLDLGFENASDELIQFKTVFATDVENWAESTINANRPHWNFLKADIQNLSTSDVLATAGIIPDMIIGGHHASHSKVGKQKATSDPLGTLYRDYVNYISALPA
ncbi:MAG: DNA cytosine methyltransferase [Candidatus Porifericomitaceae bacterium WSBS_2022_MAG_OTU9]